ncbi:hypothetical protein JRI60_47230 [Archangium violaceum]|uniref:hypothetical protein n=1 Tax=Archangium violaceum TaxID=83451 RepID=UPI001950B402|nr:hypothetical protein [Archangium violaceum]QRN96517.1 hypothetical protein JRI60_47230 [Archangium violaceum]
MTLDRAPRGDAPRSPALQGKSHDVHPPKPLGVPPSHARPGSSHLTPEARAALNSACDTAADPGAPLETSLHPGCADELVSIYNGGKTHAGQTAWNNPVTLTLNTAYAWVAQLQAGYTPEELRAFARSAYAENAFNPPGTMQRVGTTSGLAYHVQVYTDAQGRVTAHLQGCGPVADGADTLITYDQGKRCWINKVIFHQPVEKQLPRQPDAKARQVFAAGDSDTDLSFVQDATHLKLAINRNKVQLMCNAYANHQGQWLVQPMFVQPRAQGSRYPCTTAKDAAGQPLVDEAGHPFTQDYEDRVYALP